MKILVADDSMTIRRILTNALRSFGHDDIIEVDGGDLVLEELRNNEDVGLILLDWNMPVMNGLDCLKAIRADDRTRHVPVVMVTSEAMKERIVEAIRAGANNYLIKPFNPDCLKGIVEEATKKQVTC